MHTSTRIALALLAALTTTAFAQPGFVTDQPTTVYPYQPPANSFSMQNSRPNPYGPNLAPHYNQQEHRLPNQAWSQRVGQVIRKGDGGLWLVSTNGLMPKGSIVSLQREGLTLNGGEVVESGQGMALIRPWASNDIKGGDNVYLQSVAPVASAPVYDKFQVNRPTMQDPTYLYWTDLMHQEHPGQVTQLSPGLGNGFFGPGYYAPGWNQPGFQQPYWRCR